VFEHLKLMCLNCKISENSKYLPSYLCRCFRYVQVSPWHFISLLFQVKCVFVLDWTWLWYRELRLGHCKILISPNIPRLNDSELIARPLRGIIYFKLIDSRLHEPYTHSSRLWYMNYNSYQFLAWQGQTFIFQLYLYQRPMDLHALNKNDTRLWNR